MGKKNAKDKRKILIIACIVFFIIAMLVALYPLISNIVNEKYKGQVITEYSDVIEVIDETEKIKMLQDAMAYNESLVPGVTDSMSQLTLDSVMQASVEYYDLLNVGTNGMMGYVEIPKIDINLPIYHGTEALTLEVGIGHIMGTSLPVGGPNTHAVISGHSGLASERMFSDIEELVIGDTFYIHVLGETLAYQVYDINVVLPEEVDSLVIVPGQDLCTLVTCTPFGVNTHRLLVTGTRIPYVESLAEAERAAGSSVSKISSWGHEYLKGVLMGLGALLIVAAGFVIYYIRDKKKQAPIQFSMLDIEDVDDKPKTSSDNSNSPGPTPQATDTSQNS